MNTGLCYNELRRKTMTMYNDCSYK